MIIPRHEVIKAVGLDKFGLTFLADPLMKFFKIKAVNNVYKKIQSYEKDEFISQLLSELNIETDPLDDWKNKIPKSGPFILVANHPHGALDGIGLFKIIREVRPDFVFMGNFLLSRIKQMEGMVISVNPLEKHKNAYNSLSGLRAALGFLKDGGAMGMFPAAGMSNFQLSSMRIEDPLWNVSATKFIRKAKCPVLPVFIHGYNSWRFQLASYLSRDLKLVQQVPETFRKSGKKFTVTVGQAENIPAHLIKENPEILGKYLRGLVYALNN
ncbi:MAG: hypothetical protein AAF502_21920 [Bacteroidota bacterium]